jgi:hypothetical protein
MILLIEKYLSTNNISFFSTIVKIEIQNVKPMTYDFWQKLKGIFEKKWEFGVLRFIPWW